jgi:hypothetical protein
MNILGAFMLFGAAAIVLGSGSRRYALLAMVAGSIYVTEGQGINVAGFSIFSTRILEIAGLVRIVLRGELPLGHLNRIDKAVVIFNVFAVLVYCLRSSTNLANEIGMSLDWILAYFIFRSLLGGLEDLRWFLRSFVLLLLPYVFLVLLERHLGRSLWSSMGGLTASADWTRNGVLRCAGSFRHPSLMGSLGASFLALYLAMVWSNVDRPLACVGAALCLLLVWASNSGGPVNFAAVSILGWAFWKFRAKVKWIFRGLFCMLVLVALVMKAPIWFLLDRFSDITGGDGWHRAELIDQAVNHFGQWWFAGRDLVKTTSWFPYLLPDVDSADICNQFILIGLQAGVAAIALFIALLTFVFKSIASAFEKVRSNGTYPHHTEFYLWGLGVLLLGHISNWLGITYYDQFYVIWALQLAAMVSVSSEVINTPAGSNAKDVIGSVNVDHIADRLGVNCLGSSHTSRNVTYT